MNPSTHTWSTSGLWMNIATSSLYQAWWSSSAPLGLRRSPVNGDAQIFKPFCNLYFSVYADALLWYQQGKIGYKDFCWLFQELSWMDGSRKPLDGRRLRMYIMSMRELVEAYKNVLGTQIRK